ncbi:tetratricopeptide repeat protein [Sulfurisoma sediminicola]|uniref:Tetratricopeptide repeat protein n=1 Tax=Sulfurisoma sediminicola TaxID=1381557 RepID=A0A497XAI7_9PROT|nr:tetratricopeptide repeat protein [Sulfurisoma sediminicola]RLJ62656.1 tetratricopeptide repeat protein [Sulfurisoma sediminicola]
MQLLTALFLALALNAAPAFADGDSWSSPPTAIESADYAAGKRAAEARDWKSAIDAFGRVVAKEPGNAGAYNYLAFAYRKSGNLDLAFKNYREALRLDPKHRGAHEYIGEAYLMAGNVAKAEEHLKILDGLCRFGCPEYDDLKKAIADHKAKPPR